MKEDRLDLSSFLFVYYIIAIYTFYYYKEDIRMEKTKLIPWIHEEGKFVVPNFKMIWNKEF